MKRQLVALLSEAAGKINDEHTKWRHLLSVIVPSFSATILTTMPLAISQFSFYYTKLN